MLEPNQPTFEIALTHFIVSDDVERSRRFYTEVLGGKTVRTGEPSFGALANSSIIINVGAGPTDDKPTVTLETPRDPDRDQQLPQHPGLGHPSCVQRVERARRGVPHTTETAQDRDPLLHARPRWAPDRGRPNHPGRQLAPVLDRQLMRQEAPTHCIVPDRVTISRAIRKRFAPTRISVSATKQDLDDARGWVLSFASLGMGVGSAGADRADPIAVRPIESSGGQRWRRSSARAAHGRC